MLQQNKIQHLFYCNTYFIAALVYVQYMLQFILLQHIFIGYKMIPSLTIFLPLLCNVRSYNL